VAVAFRRGRLYQGVTDRAVPQRLRHPHRPAVRAEDRSAAVHEVPERGLTGQDVLEGMPSPRPPFHAAAVELGSPVAESGGGSAPTARHWPPAAEMARFRAWRKALFVTAGEVVGAVDGRRPGVVRAATASAGSLAVW